MAAKRTWGGQYMLECYVNVGCLVELFVYFDDYDDAAL